MSGGAFPSVVNLAALGTKGFRIQGEAAGDAAGFSVAGAGDVNGDGRPDLAVSAIFNDAGGENAGAAYVVFGADQALPNPISLTDIARGEGGFKIVGELPNDRAGIAVAAAGDVDGDGLDDLVIGALDATRGYNNGAAYILFGRPVDQPFAPTVALTTIAAGDGGFKIVGEAGGNQAGRAVAAAGDVNGDGFAEVVIGAPYGGSGNNSGAAYVVFGQGIRPSSMTELDQFGNIESVVKIVGENQADRAGFALAAGDVNADGFDDLIIGAPSNSSGGQGAGAAYVVFGAANGLPKEVDLADIASGRGGFKVQGEGPGHRAGASVSAAGDINGDGIADLVVGAYWDDGGGSKAGAAYVVFGGANGFSPVIDLAQLAQDQSGFKIQGESPGDQAGRSVAIIGDINGDGIDDLLIGADNAGGNYQGAAYVVYGKRDGFPDLEHFPIIRSRIRRPGSSCGIRLA